MVNNSALLDYYSFLETKSSNQVPVCTNNAYRVKAIGLRVDPLQRQHPVRIANVIQRDSGFAK
jgi:hypothetical protein